jgi:streptogramin lyase
LHLAQDGSIWVGTSLEGLARIQQDTITVFTIQEGLSSNEIRALAEDRDGALWIGTKSNGLSCFKDGAFTLFSMKNGLPNNSIQCLYIDQEDALWIGTRKGLCRRKDGVFACYSVKQGLFANHIYGLVEDSRGYLWMGCGKGIFHVSLQQLHDFAAGKIAAFDATQYGREYGISGSVAVGHNPVVLRTLDNRIWFATLEGLVVVDPASLSTNRIPPPVHLEEMTIDQRSYLVGQPADAPAGNGDMTFRYTALSFEAPERIQFKYKLEDFDSDWRDAGTRRIAYYTNVPPGSYRFQVIACNKDGIWNETGADFALRLAPHFHQTYWFYGLVALLVALAGAATQRLHMVQLKRRERELAARVHDALAQIKVLKGLLPICASCKKIRDDTGYWQQMESYIREHSEVEFSHGICPDCMRKLYPDYVKRKEQAAK